MTPPVLRDTVVIDDDDDEAEEKPAQPVVKPPPRLSLIKLSEDTPPKGINVIKLPSKASSILKKQIPLMAPTPPPTSIVTTTTSGNRVSIIVDKKKVPLSDGILTVITKRKAPADAVEATEQKKAKAEDDKSLVISNVVSLAQKPKDINGYLKSDIPGLGCVDAVKTNGMFILKLKELSSKQQFVKLNDLQAATVLLNRYK
jgi:hypothetical protein